MAGEHDGPDPREFRFRELCQADYRPVQAHVINRLGAAPPVTSRGLRAAITAGRPAPATRQHLALPRGSCRHRRCGQIPALALISVNLVPVSRTDASQRASSAGRQLRQRPGHGGQAAACIYRPRRDLRLAD